MRNNAKISAQNINKSNKAAPLLTKGKYNKYKCKCKYNGEQKYEVCELRANFPSYIRLVKDNEHKMVKSGLSNDELVVDTNKKIIKKEQIMVNNVELDIKLNKYYTVSEVAEFLRCKIGTVYTWKWQKKIKAHKCSGKLLFLGKDIKNSIVEQI